MIDQIFSAITVPGVPSFLGPQFRSQADAPPVIVWEPSTGQFAYGKRVNKYDSPDPRSLATCTLKVTCYLWAAWPEGTPFPAGYDQSTADYKQLWELIRTFLVALRAAAPGAYHLGDLRLLTEEGNAFTELGKAAEVDVYWDIPVTADPLQSVTISSEDNLQMEGTLDTANPVTEAPSP